MNNFNASKVRQALLFPLKAIISLRFYFVVLFQMRGMGGAYIMLLALFMSVPGSYQVQKALHYYTKLELPTLVGQIPPSHVDNEYHLIPNPNEEAYKVISTSQGVPTLIYNPYNRPLTDDARGALIELGKDAIILHGENEDTLIPYSAILVTNTEFEPLNSAVALDRIFNAPVYTLILFVFIWFDMLLMFNSLLAALFAKVLLLFIAGIKISYTNTVRLCAYGNTLTALILLLQCFVFLPVSFSLLLLIPLVYCILFALEFRRELVTLGLEAFSQKYGFRMADGSQSAVNRQHEIDKLTGRVSEYEESRNTEEGNNESVFENQTINDEQVQENVSNSPENSATDAQSMHNKDKKDEHRGSGYFTP